MKISETERKLLIEALTTAIDEANNDISCCDGYNDDVADYARKRSGQYQKLLQKLTPTRPSAS